MGCLFFYGVIEWLHPYFGYKYASSASTDASSKKLSISALPSSILIQKEMAQRCGNDVVGPKRFFKIVLETTAPNLTIPTCFARRYGDRLPNVVKFVPPTGRNWFVNIERSEQGELFFGNGWVEFREHYSISFGYCIIFAYDLESTFEIDIFDLTCTPIDYFSDYSDDEGDVAVGGEAQRNVFNGGDPSNMQEVNGGNQAAGESRAHRQAVYLIGNIPNGTSFIIKELSLTDVTGDCEMIIPMETAKSIFTRKHTTITLQVRGGGSSTMKVTFANKTRVTSGWKQIVNVNQLKAGDCVVFVIEPNDADSWEAVIFKS